MSKGLISLIYGLLVLLGAVFLFCLAVLAAFHAELCLYFTGCSDSTDPVLSQISENPLTTSFQAAADPQWTYQYPSCDGGGQETQNNVLNDWRMDLFSWAGLFFHYRPRALFVGKCYFRHLKIIHSYGHDYMKVGKHEYSRVSSYVLRWDSKPTKVKRFISTASQSRCWTIHICLPC